MAGLVRKAPDLADVPDRVALNSHFGPITKPAVLASMVHVVHGTKCHDKKTMKLQLIVMASLFDARDAPARGAQIWEGPGGGA